MLQKEIKSCSTAAVVKAITLFRELTVSRWGAVVAALVIYLFAK